GRNITWAVIDSGIDQNHPHFSHYSTLGGDVMSLHRDFTQPGDPQLGNALTDGYGHGTHVGGIIAGGLCANAPYLRVVEQVQDPDEQPDPSGGRRTISRNRAVDPALLAGIAPHTNLVSLKVLDDAGKGSSMNVVRALEYVRTQVNGQKLMRVHGVNLSV